MRSMKYETWETGFKQRPYGLAVYDHKAALKINNYLGRYYESLEADSEPIFFLTKGQFDVIFRLYLEQRIKHA